MADDPTEISSFDDSQAPILVVGRYKLIRRIGMGGMGDVYEAEQQQPRRLVAIKLMRGRGRDALASQSARERFEREAEHLAKLTHPNIAQVYEAGTHVQGALSLPFFVMELVKDAQPITSWAAAHNLSIGQRLRLMAIVCDAVHHAHEQGVCHRDLKPSNILLDQDGTPKVIDFGLADAIAPNDSQHAPSGESDLNTDASLLMGTPPYMSPEQFSGSPNDDLGARRAGGRAADVYALGVVLYELLCGRLPYQLPVSRESQRVVTFAEILRTTSPPWPRSLNRLVTRDTEAVLLKCLSKNPTERYESAAALGRELRRLLAGEPVEARRRNRIYTVGARARHIARRFNGSVVIGACVIAFVVAEVLGFWVDTRFTNDRFESLMTSRPLFMHFDRNASLKNVRLIGITPGVDYAKLAREQGVSAVDPARDVRSLRRLHGKLMQRLADANVRPRVVAWDLYFNGNTPHDADFAAGLSKLKERGVPIVVGASAWDSGVSQTSKAIESQVELAGMTATLTPDAPWSIHLVWKRGVGHARASLPLAVAARCWFPTAAAPPSLELHSGSVALISKSDAAESNHTCTITSTVPQPRREHPTAGLHEGDLIGHYFLEIPAQPVLDEATVSYEQVLRASDKQLHRWFDGRVVVIGDLRPKADGPFQTADGRELAGCYAMTVAIERLLSDEPIRRAPVIGFAGAYIGGRHVLEGAVAVVGALLGVIVQRRLGWRYLVAALLVVSICLSSIIAYKSLGLLLCPVVPVIAFLLLTETSAWTRRLAHPSIL